MKHLTTLMLTLLTLISLSPTVVAQTGGSAQQPKLPAQELDKLLAPVALYPDVLLSQILPASTFPIEVVQAARWMHSKPDMSKLDGQAWDPSVKALCRYENVLYKLDNDLDWTNALGAAFLSQQQDVMDTVQRLRHKAQAAGSLRTTNEQTVVVEQAAVRIVPTQADVVYVPQYDPTVVFVYDDDNDVSAGAAAAASAVSFGAGLALGAWLNTDCDWHGHCVAYCQPGYWGGWAHTGVVHYGDNWAAAAGPRRAAVVGENGGAYVGPRGAAVWGENGHGAAWRRPTTYGRPAYTGRYAQYNQASVTRNSVNVNRGDRNTTISGGNTIAAGGNRTNSGDRTPGGQRRDSGYTNSRAGSDSSGYRRSNARTSSGSSYGRSSFGDSRGSSQMRSYSSRGSSSRASVGGSRGGGGRRGRR